MPAALPMTARIYRAHIAEWVQWVYGNQDLWDEAEELVGYMEDYSGLPYETQAARLEGVRWVYWCLLVDRDQGPGPDGPWQEGG